MKLVHRLGRRARWGSAGVSGGLSAQPPLDFAVDFSYALGTSNDAVCGGLLAGPASRRFTQRGGTSGEVIASTGLGFPTANVLRITDAWCLVRKTGLVVPSVGQSRYYRFYIRVTQNDNSGGDGKTHPVQDGNSIGVSNWGFYVRNYPSSGTAPGTWRMSFQSLGTAYPQDQFTLPVDLSRAVTYRVEHRVHRIGSATWNLHVRVYDDLVSTTVPLYGNADFVAEGAGGTLAALPTLTLPNVANLDGLNGGVNGTTGDEGTYGYESGFATTLVDWIGAYRLGEQAAA